MWVKLTTSISSNIAEFNFLHGDVVDLETKYAERLIASGQAEKVEKKAVKADSVVKPVVKPVIKEEPKMEIKEEDAPEKKVATPKDIKENNLKK